MKKCLVPRSKNESEVTASSEEGEEEEEEEEYVRDEEREKLNRNCIALSCIAFCGLLALMFRRCRGSCTTKRQGDVRLSYTPQNGLMVRMSAGGTRGSPEDVREAEALIVCEKDTSLRNRSDESRSVFLPRATSFSGGQEAEERLLSRAAGRPASTSTRPKFLTLHRRRRRRPPTRGLTKNIALLDDIYNGPTQCALDRVAMWDFNAFALDSVCGGRPVAILCVFLMHQYDLINAFDMDTVAVWKCFSLIEEGYHASNPYHNAIHAADVTQAMHCYLQESIIDQHLTPLEKLAALIASVCHDLDHPGVNQPFLIATDNHLAALYNNASVLENHHWRCAMGCLWESGLMEGWPSQRVSDLQEMIRSLILATDITRQNEFLSRFKKYQETDTLDMTDSECRHFSLQIALKCADICNPCRPWQVSKIWSHKICDEFYRQGDYERQLRLPVTALCDRYVTSVARIQTGFINFVVFPLFESWNKWLRTNLSSVMLKYLQQNLVKWEYFLSEEVKSASSVASTGSSTVEEQVAPIPVCITSSTTSSAGSRAASILGSLESVAQPLPLGRRHSLPLTVPSLLPRTFIRRESLSEAGQPPIVLQTVLMGRGNEFAFATLDTSTEEEAEDVFGLEGSADDNLFPEPTITAMGELGRPRRLPHIGSTRRQSLPPMCGSLSVLSRVHPLQPFTRTSLQEELPPKLGKPGTITSSERTGNGDSKGGDGSNDGGGASTTTSANNCPLMERKSSLAGICSESYSQKGILSESDVRRSYLESCSLKNKKDHSEDEGKIKQRADQENEPVTACKLSSRSYQYGSPKQVIVSNKENLAPSKAMEILCPCDDKSDKQSAILRTRLWRSLNQEEEGCYRGSIYKTMVHQHAKGRRSSAPLLKYEELREGLKGGGENLFGDRHSRRRGSAPVNHLCAGSDALRIHQFEKLFHTPLLPRENVQLNNGRSPTVSFPLPRRGSAPGDIKCSLTYTDLSHRSKQPEVSCNAKAYKGSCMGCDYSVTQSTAEGCHGLPWSEVRRGSGGLELLSGLWRLHMEQNSASSDDSVGVLSSGGDTPGTPVTFGHPTICQPAPSHVPLPFCRRGSLPTDIYTSVDMRKWSLEAS